MYKMETDINQTTISDMRGTVVDFSVATKQTEGVSDAGETRAGNDNFTKWYGYYKTIPELKKAIDSLATWTVGKGYIVDSGTNVILDHISGRGAETFQDIIWNLQVIKKINGNAFAEIIRSDNGTLINLKPLDPSSMVAILNKQGRIIRYEQITKTYSKSGVRTFKPNEILHLSNDRVADENNGTSVVEARQWVIDARNEAMNDWKRISHRSTIRVMYIDAEDTSKLSKIKTEYATAIKYGELMLIPGKKGEAEFADLSTPPINNFLEWIRYLEGFFYAAVGVPRVIASSENYTESGAKVGFLTFEPVYTWEQTLLEADLWNQLAIRIKFNRPPSLGGELQRDEQKDGQAFQPNDVQAGIGQ